MLMNGEIKWLFAYTLILVAAIAAAIKAPWKAWKTALLAVFGVPVVLFGWLWQVGRYG